MSRWHHVDGFQVVSGVVSLAAGPIMLAAGAPSGWAFLVLGAGIALLGAQWVIAGDIVFDAMRAADITAVAVGLAAAWIAAVYLTHTANDLPRLLPGHDADSASVCVVQGVVAAVIAGVALGRACVAAHPRSATRA